MTDDQRWDEARYMPVVQQRLGGAGTSFRNSFVTTSLCCPSRASFLSGQYAHNHGIVTLGGATRFDARSTLAVWLANAGYRTALIGKYMNNNGHLAPRIPPGWHVWRTFADTFRSYGQDWFYYDYELNEDGRIVAYGDRPEDYSTDVLAEMAVEFVRASAPGPFLLVLTPFAPHVPPRPAPRHAGAFASIEIDYRANAHEPDVSDKPPHIRDQPGRAEWSGRRDELVAGIRSRRVPVLESLLAVDEAVGAILDALDELGIDERTAVIFTSDNGFMWGEHWKLGKLYAYEESIRVPLLIRYPLLGTAPRELDEMALNIDLAPTIAELAGVPIPASVDGRSLLPLLEGRKGSWRRDFLIELPPDGDRFHFAAVRTPRWKYVANSGDPPFEELYDLETDPFELDNRLAVESPDLETLRVAAGLRERLAALLRE